MKNKWIFVFKIFTLFMLFICTLIFSSLVYAASISVTKATMDFPEVLKGGYAQDVVYVATDTDFDVPLTYETQGDIKDWISFNPTLNETVYISNTHIQALTIIIEPPADTPAGNYTGAVRVITGTVNRPDVSYGSQIQAAFLIRINVEVTGREKLLCSVGGINIQDVELARPLEYSMSVYNLGNVRIRPNVTLEFWNQDQNRIIATKTSDFNRMEILPTTSRVLSTQFTNNLKVGQYWVYATVSPCDNSELISFSVLEKGSIADVGDLIRIESVPWAKVGDTVPITAYFRNGGTRVVTAKLKGLIKYNDRIVNNIDSEYYDFKPGELSNITIYYKPTKPGQYFVSGRVLYNNKLSFEKSTIINVNGEPLTEFNYIYIILIVIIILIIILVFAIRKKRRRF